MEFAGLYLNLQSVWKVKSTDQDRLKKWHAYYLLVTEAKNKDAEHHVEKIKSTYDSESTISPTNVNIYFQW
jgi:hypothetical protein